MTRVHAAIAIVLRDRQVLICQRRADDRFAGCWEFPGGKCEDGESPLDCLHRELWEEVGIRAEPIGALPHIDHDYPHIRLRLHPFLCRHTAGQPAPLASQAVRWVEPPALREFTFPPANEQLIERVIGMEAEISNLNSQV